LSGEGVVGEEGLRGVNTSRQAGKRAARARGLFTGERKKILMTNREGKKD